MTSREARCPGEYGVMLWLVYMPPRTRGAFSTTRTTLGILVSRNKLFIIPLAAEVNADFTRFCTSSVPPRGNTTGDGQSKAGCLPPPSILTDFRRYWAVSGDSTPGRPGLRRPGTGDRVFRVVV